MDLYLQPVFELERSVYDFFELKYVKAHATQHTQEIKEQEGRRELQVYCQSAAARRIPRLKAYLLIFCKDRCIRIIPNP